MDADERRALEEELAAALAELSDDDHDSMQVEDDAVEWVQGSNYAIQEYARLDLDQVLRQVAMETVDGSLVGVADEDSSDTQPTSWHLLLATIAKCDSECFQAFQRELHDVHMTILSSSPPQVASCDKRVEIERSSSESVGDHNAPKEASLSPPAAAQFTEGGIGDTEDEAQGSIGGLSSKDAPSLLLEVPQIETSVSSAASAGLTLRDQSATTTTTITKEDIVTTNTEPAIQEQVNEIVTAPEQHQPAASLDTKSPSLVVDQTQLQWIQDRYDERQRVLIKVQENYQRQQQQLALHMEQLEQQWALREHEAQEHAIKQREANELRVMQLEELTTRKWMAAVAQIQECSYMAREELTSRLVRAYLRAQHEVQQRELNAMTLEEKHARKLIRLEAEMQRKERLMEEKCVLRRRFHAVLFQMIANHEAKMVEIQKREADTRKRELREATAMRSEELLQRRVMAQVRALEDEQRRQQERDGMVQEDTFAKAWAFALQRTIMRDRLEMEQEDYFACEWRAQERREQNRNRLAMAQEEELARRVQLQEVQLQNRRQQQRREACLRILLLCKKHHLSFALRHWKQVVEQHHDAACRIQRAYRHYLIHQSKHDDITSEVLHSLGSAYDSADAAAAAMVVQSTFRGFSIRRKFANALEMANLVGRSGDYDDVEFGEVNLDDLIQMPPELEDGWEDPVLPAPRPSYPYQGGLQQHREVSHQENEAVDERDEGHRSPCEYQQQITMPSAERNPRGIAINNNNNNATHEQLHDMESQAQPVPTNLAASLWDKMRKLKQRQRYAADERIREQDPTYRLQKLMHKGSSKPRAPSVKASSNNSAPLPSAPDGHNTASSAPTVVWGTSGEKKKPKVKLPSLVERLRKKTEAAR